MSGMVKMVVLGDKTHRQAGRLCAQGDEIEVSPAVAEWMEARNIAKRKVTRATRKAKAAADTQQEMNDASA